MTSNGSRQAAPPAQSLTRTQRALQIAQQMAITSRATGKGGATQPVANCGGETQALPTTKLFAVDFIEFLEEWRHLEIAAPADCKEDDLAIVIGKILADGDGIDLDVRESRLLRRGRGRRCGTQSGGRERGFRFDPR